MFFSEEIENFINNMKRLNVLNSNVEINELIINELKKKYNSEKLFNSYFYSLEEYILKKLIDYQNFNNTVSAFLNSNQCSPTIIKHFLNQAINYTLENQQIVKPYNINIEDIKCTQHPNYYVDTIFWENNKLVFKQPKNCMLLYLKYGLKTKHNLKKNFLNENSYKYFYKDTEKDRKIILTKYKISNTGEIFYKISGDGNNRVQIAKIFNFLDNRFSIAGNFVIDSEKHIDLKEVKKYLVYLLKDNFFFKEKKKENKEENIISFVRKIFKR